MRQSGDDPKASACISMVMIPMLHGDKTNATSRLNSTSQIEVSTEENILQVEYSLLKNRRLDK
jgi:hypothetical protein